MLWIFSDKQVFRNLRYLRKKYYLSKRAACLLLGISPARLRWIEEETCKPEMDDRLVKRICQVFDVCVEDLVHRDLSEE